jgi:hypothetical protein
MYLRGGFIAFLVVNRRFKLRRLFLYVVEGGPPSRLPLKLHPPVYSRFRRNR